MSLIQRIAATIEQRPEVGIVPAVPAAGMSVYNIMAHAQIVIGIIGGLMTIIYTGILIWLAVSKHLKKTKENAR